MNIDEIKYSLKNLAHRKTRSLLTVLSILIGVMAIFAIISFGLGIQNYMDELAKETGTDKLFLQARSIGAPGTDDTFSLTKDDADFISKIKGVAELAPMYMKPAEVKLDDQKKYFYASGIRPQDNKFAFESFGIGIYKGRELKDGDVNKITLGYLYQFEGKVFDRALNVGDKLELNNKKYEIAGFYEEVGNPQDDANVYMTFEGYESLFPEGKDKYGFIMIRSAPDIEPSDLADKITEKFRKYKDQEEGKETFFVQTFEDALATFGAVIGVLNGILVLIALISLVVASVNIMNTMYTAVLERTKEIGIMKALGAQNHEILFVFIFESGVLGLVGGVIGVLFGYVIAAAGGAIAATSGFSSLQPIFPWYLILGCLAFSFFVGAISGVLPAVQASNQKPVDALRYE